MHYFLSEAQCCLPFCTTVLAFEQFELNTSKGVIAHVEGLMHMLEHLCPTHYTVFGFEEF